MASRVSSVRALGAALALLAVGCASTTQTLVISPELKVRGAVDARGVAVAIEVEDRRGAPPPRAEGEPEIAIEPGVDLAVRRAVLQGLAQQGFVTSAAGAVRQLRVEIQEASLTTETGTGTMLVRTRATIRVAVRNGRTLNENTYRAQQERRVVLLPSSTQNEEQLNFVVNHALQQFFDDRALLSALRR